MHSKGLFSILIHSGGNVIGTLFSAVSLILFSRFMGPSEFGIFSAAFALMQIVVRLSDLGINTAVERSVARINSGETQLSDRFVRVGLWLRTVTALVTVLIGLIFADPISLHLLKIQDSSLIKLSLLLSLGTVFFEYTSVILQSHKKFVPVAQMTVAQGCLKFVFGLVLIWQRSLSAMSALVVYGLAPMVGALPIWRRSLLDKLALPSGWNVELTKIIKVAKWTALAIISASFADNIDTLFVQSYLTTYDTGLWSAAVRIALFAGIIGWSINSVLSNRVASYHKKIDLDKYLGKAKLFAIGMFLLVVLAIPFSKLAILFTAGKLYLEAVPILKLLFISTAISVATTPFTALFYLFDQPKFYTYSGILQILFLVIGDIVAIPIFGLQGAAWVRIIMRVVVMVFTLLFVYYAYQIHVKNKLSATK